MTTERDRIAEASAVRPTPRQLAWQQLEFYGFIHFGMNTMTGREWGLGHEDPKLFDPVNFDAEQWARSFAAAGMRGLILTCKHHDGFCLWPSEVTSHSVASSPWRDGNGDAVAEVAMACSKHGLRFGVYLSPWDRTETSYGSGVQYDDFFVVQLRELLTRYGPIFSVWLDGANGEGANGDKQLYDWERYYAVIRQLQPNAVISVCGPDVRWCGNEAGHTRTDEWSVVPASLRDAERTASVSQRVDDGRFSRIVGSDEEDLGSRAAILSHQEPLVWYPAEVNTSIRPGWFYHAGEDDKVRSPSELFDIYRSSVGGNATLLLNVPPAPDGLIANRDVEVLAELGGLIAGLYARDIAKEARISALAGSYNLDMGWYEGRGSGQFTLVVEWDVPVTVDCVILSEFIEHGQQVDDARIEIENLDGRRVLVASIRSIGYRRVTCFAPVAVRKILIIVTSHRGTIALRTRPC